MKKKIVWTAEERQKVASKIKHLLETPELKKINPRYRFATAAQLAQKNVLPKNKQRRLYTEGRRALKNLVLAEAEKEYPRIEGREVETETLRIPIPGHALPEQVSVAEAKVNLDLVAQLIIAVASRL